MPSHESTIENLRQIYFLWTKGKLPWDTLPKQSKGIQGLVGISEVDAKDWLTFSGGGEVCWSVTDWLTKS